MSSLEITDVKITPSSVYTEGRFVISAGVVDHTIWLVDSQDYFLQDKDGNFLTAGDDRD